MIILLLFLILLALLVPGFVKGLLQLIVFGALALIAAVADPDHAQLIGIGYCVAVGCTIRGGIVRRLKGH